MPPVHRYGEFSDNFCTPDDKPSPIQWDIACTESIPPLIPSLKFCRHWEFGLIEDSVWESMSLTLVQKLNRGLFWDHCGDEKREKSVREGTLNCDYIRKINGIHSLGIITDSRDAVKRCSKCEFSHAISTEVIKARSQAETKRNSLQPTSPEMGLPQYLVE